MSEPLSSQSLALRDFQAAREFILSDPDFPRKISKDNWREVLDELPRPVRRFVRNMAKQDWNVAVQYFEKGEAKSEIELLRPLVESFRPYIEEFGREAEAPVKKLYQNEITSLTSDFTYELTSRIPLLQLEFYGDDHKLLFSNRESIDGTLGTARIILNTVSRSVSYCKESGASINPKTQQQLEYQLKEMIRDLLLIASSVGISQEDIQRIAKAPEEWEQEEENS